MIKNSNQAKRYPKFANFGEYLYWSYANLQMHICNDIQL